MNCPHCALDLIEHRAKLLAHLQAMAGRHDSVKKLWEEKGEKTVDDIIAANPPYVPSGDLPVLQPEVRDYEPVMALIAGPGGTEIHRRIIETAPAFLKKGGTLIMELGQGQAEALRKIVGETGQYHSPEILKDLAGIERVIVTHRR